MSKEEEIRRLYDETSNFYDARYRDIQFRKYFDLGVNGFLEGLVLDAGCGTGLLFDFLDEKSHFFLVGIDISFEMLRIAREKTKFGMIVAGDVQHLPFKPQSFHGVLSVSVLQNLSSVERGLFELVSTCSVPGKLLFSVLRKKVSRDFVYGMVEEICGGLGLDCLLREVGLSLEDNGFLMELFRKK